MRIGGGGCVCLCVCVCVCVCEAWVQLHETMKLDKSKGIQTHSLVKGILLHCLTAAADMDASSSRTAELA